MLNRIALGALATASAFVSFGAAAADLPSRKAEPVAYVKICDAYGAGFFYIPGTDTCLRVGGRVRAEYGYITRGTFMLPPVIGNGNATPNGNAFAVSNTTGATTAGTMAVTAKDGVDATGFHTRGNVILDARTQTPWGTVRTNISIRGVNETGVFASNYIRNTLSSTGGASITVDLANVQFAGFTFGRARENFTFMPGANYIFIRRAGFASGINQLTYTATFGGGFSATISLEDRSGLNSSTSPHSLGGVGAAVGPLSRAGVIVGNGPMTWPALVGNVRLEQGWGSAQLMGAVVQNSAALVRPATFLPTPTASGEVVVNKVGYAIGGGLKINLPMLAAGDEFWFQGAWSRGAFDWIISNNTSAQTSDHGHELPGLQRIDRNLTVFGVGGCAGTIAGGCALTGLGSEQTVAWQVAGMFIHYWTPTIRSVFMASYIDITPGAQTRNTDWSLGGMSKANSFIISKAIQWFPVKTSKSASNSATPS